MKWLSGRQVVLVLVVALLPVSIAESEAQELGRLEFASTDGEFLNPERGFYRYRNLDRPTNFASIRDQGHALIYGRVHLRDVSEFLSNEPSVRQVLLRLRWLRAFVRQLVRWTSDAVTPNRTMSNPSDRKRLIVLLHGYAAHWTLMVQLARRFQAAGYQTINWGYNSWFKPIEFHAARLRTRVQHLDADDSVESIHFVTHSMGCIVTRAALATGLPMKVGRWVMLAPPNKGSYVANRVPPFMRSWLTPLEELRASEDSYVNQLPILEGIDIAIIQASLDYIVAESLTQIDHEKDRLVVPALHSQMLFRQDVAGQSLHFLEHGRFAHPSSEQTSVNDDS